MEGSSMNGLKAAREVLFAPVPWLRVA